MCGLVGGIGKGSSETIYSYINLLNRRGPDHQAVKTLSNGLTFGSTRLAMTDPNPRSNQPMVDLNSENMIVFNGEIYNYKIIRENLAKKGVKFDTEGDTEVLLKALCFFGPEIIPTLQGMFSFSFYDKRKNMLLIARDYLGKKPLYYYLGENEFFFASNLDLINKFKKGLNLNLESIKTYLRLGYLVDPFTMYEKIDSVKPGEIISIDLDKIKIVNRTLFIPNALIDSKGIEISTGFSEALTQRVDGHSKFAISLSGGIDSSILALECSKLGLNAEAYSMSWSFSDKEKYQSDAYAAKEIASMAGINHRIIEMPKPDQLDAILTEYVMAMGEPNSNPTGLSMMVLYSEIAKDNHRLVLTGDGADEIFGGYERYELANRLNFFPKLNLKVLKEFVTDSEIRSKLLKRFLPSVIPPNSDEFWLYWHLLARESTINKLISILPETRQTVYGDELTNLYDSRNVGAAQLMFKDLKTWLPMESNRKLDRISMWYSIEARSPFQSERVIAAGYRKMQEFNFSKVKKEILISNFPEIRNYPTLPSKSGFISPLGYWLRNNPDLIKTSLESITNYLPFERKKLFALSNSANEGNYEKFKVLWSLIVLNRWFVVNV
jgi:asparagine synthase (glutamine-hydrolysing)